MKSSPEENKINQEKEKMHFTFLRGLCIISDQKYVVISRKKHSGRKRSSIYLKSKYCPNKTCSFFVSLLQISDKWCGEDSLDSTKDIIKKSGGT